MFSRSGIYTLSFALSTVAAYWYEQAEPTQTEYGAPMLGWSPNPTGKPVPNKGRIPLHGLFARQKNPASVCGYISGSSSRPLTCSYGRTCFYNSWVTAIGCCERSDDAADVCGQYTSCIPRTAVSSCTGSCQLNTLIVKCTQLTAAECWTYAFPDGYTNVGCFSTSGLDSVEYTTPGQTIPGSDTPDPTPDPTRSSSPISSVSPVISSSVRKPIPPKKGPPVGAIVGGVIGGLIVIGAIIALVTWIIMRNKAKRPQFVPEPPYAQHQPSQQPPPPMEYQQQGEQVKAEYTGNQPAYTQPPPQPMPQQQPIQQQPIQQQPIQPTQPLQQQHTGQSFPPYPTGVHEVSADPR